jgi:peptidoglycan hydrolase CwlO-like protein
MPENMPEHTLEAMAASTASLRDVVAALESEENRLAGELATVKAKRMAVSKALAALEDTTPKRRRGRPRKSAAKDATPVAA